ncbi:MAG: hypothetical protein GY947_19725 [Rhodobacteraceae bacterium]|nr:hypothetical protein [Paracoccaceae bacterium]
MKYWQIRHLKLSVTALAWAINVMGSAASDAGRLKDIEKTTLMWGSFLAPSSVRSDDSENAKFEIYAKTSFAILSFGNKSTVQAYSIFAAIRDSQELDFNSKVKAGFGLELRHQLSKAVRLSFGARWDSEYRIYSGTTYNAPVATADVSLYKSWKPQWLRKRVSKKGELVLSGWSNIRYPAALEPAERSNILLQGAFKAAVVFPLAGTRMKVAPFVSTSFKKDSQGRPWNNYIEPAIGLDLKIPVGRRGELVAGVKTLQQSRFVSGEVQFGTLGYLSWYKHF